MFDELKVIENIDILFETKVILYGAGYHGKRIFNMLKAAGIPVMYFCDSNPKKWGQVIGGKEIISPQALKELDAASKVTIIITVESDVLVIDMINTLESLCLKTTSLLTPLGLDILLLQNVNSPRISDEYRNFSIQTSKLKKDLSLYKKKAFDIRVFLDELYPVNEILVYSPPKVGTTTVVFSLNSSGLRSSHHHWYVSGNTPEMIDLKLDTLKKLNNIKIITLVREPLSRDFSHDFQNIGTYGLSYFMSAGDSFVDTCVKTIKERAFRLSSEGSCHGFEFDWFDCELKAVFGIDIFAHPFDKEKGYSIIKQGNVEVLVMKLEKLSSLEPVIGEFAGAPDFKLISANESSGKAYKYLYQNVRKAIKIPRDVVSLYYDNNLRLDYFYTDEEKAAFLKKWEKNIAD